QRSRVYFDHLETSQTVEFRTCSNVSIDRHLHKNVEANLVFTEVAPPIAINENGERETLMLNGNVTVYYPTELDIAEQKKIEAVFVEAVRMITNIGLGKSRGLGFAETRLNAPEGGWLCESE
ncbi:MAG: hypothetical protein J6P20_02670, partial [Oscillospiraceae bacterium]|nr:hypothetical protein [Oscillospiraceae bacterium]